MSESGHNSGIAAQQLKHLVERIERLTEEKQAIQKDVAEVYAECEAFGYDKKIVRKVVQIREMDAAKRQEEEALLDLYMSALGMMPADQPRAKVSRVHSTTADSGPGAPGVARSDSLTLDAGAAVRYAPDPSCKPGGATLASPGEASETATDKPEPSGASTELPPSPESVPDGAGVGSVAPPATHSLEVVPADAGADPLAQHKRPALAPGHDDLQIPAFLDRRAQR